MFARMLLTDFPSIDSVHGVVIFAEEDTPVKIHCTAVVLDQCGTIGLSKGIKSFDGPTRLSEEKFEHKNFQVAIKELINKHRFDIILSPDDLIR